MEACDGKTRDNFSFYIIPIQKVEDSMGFKTFHSSVFQEPRPYKERGNRRVEYRSR